MSRNQNIIKKIVSPICALPFPLCAEYGLCFAAPPLSRKTPTQCVLRDIFLPVSGEKEPSPGGRLLRLSKNHIADKNIV